MTHKDLLQIPKFLLDLTKTDEASEMKALMKKTKKTKKVILADQERLKLYTDQTSTMDTASRMVSFYYTHPETKKTTSRFPFPTPKELWYLDPAAKAAEEKKIQEKADVAEKAKNAWKHERQGDRNNRLDKQIIDIIYKDLLPMKKRTKRMVIDFFRKNFMNDFKAIQDKYLSGHIGRGVDRLTKLQQIEIDLVGKGKNPKKVYILGRLAKVSNMSIVQAEQSKKARQQRDQRSIYMRNRYEAKMKGKGKKK